MHNHHSASASRTATAPVTNGLFSDAEWEALVTHMVLPERQAQILRLLLGGDCDKQIARKLSLSLPTIRTHLQRIFTRFGVANRTSLVVEVFRQFRALEKSR